METAEEKFTMKFRQTLEKVIQINNEGIMHYGIYSTAIREITNTHNKTGKTQIPISINNNISFKFCVNYFEMNPNNYLIIYDVSPQTEKEIDQTLEEMLCIK